MRFDLLSGLRKWRLIGALALMLVAITSVSTTIHALHCATASTINPGDSEACGLCNVETSAVPPIELSVDVVLSELPGFQIPTLDVCKSPRDTSFFYTLRGPPVAA